MMDIRIKYIEGATRLEQIEKGNWIDVYSNVDVFIPLGDAVKIPLGFALELPKGFEGHMLPRSSTYDRWDKTKGTWIKKGDKIAQFRIQEAMPKVNFIEVESFGNPDRGGFGTTGGK